MKDELKTLKEMVPLTGIPDYFFRNWKYIFENAEGKVSAFPEPMIIDNNKPFWSSRQIFAWLNRNYEHVNIMMDERVLGMWFVVPHFPIDDKTKEQVEAYITRMKNNPYLRKLNKFNYE